MKLQKIVLAGLMGWTLALCVGTAKADIIVPYNTPSTTITLTNPTAKTITGSANFNGTGPIGTGTETVMYSLAAFSEANVANPVTMEPRFGIYPSVKIVPDIDPSTGAQFLDPITHVFECDGGNGHNVPAWGSAERANTEPLAGNLRTGVETLAVSSGGYLGTFTVTYYGPHGEGPFQTDLHPLEPNASTTIPVNYLLGGVSPGANIEVHFYAPTWSSGRAALLYTDPATLDTRVEEMKRYTPTQQPADQVAKAYVQKWLPPNDSRFYLNNDEAHALINGDGKGTPSYAQNMAAILINSSSANGQTADQLTQWLKDQADCNLANGELIRASDPLYWTNASYGTKGLAFFEEGPSTAGFPLEPTDLQSMYSLLRVEFIWRFVMNNPELYGGTVGGLPNLDYDPTWYTGDWNDYVCP